MNCIGDSCQQGSRVALTGYAVQTKMVGDGTKAELANRADLGVEILTADYKLDEPGIIAIPSLKVRNLTTKGIVTILFQIRLTSLSGEEYVTTQINDSWETDEAFVPAMSEATALATVAVRGTASSIRIAPIFVAYTDGSTKSLDAELNKCVYSRHKALREEQSALLQSLRSVDEVEARKLVQSVKHSRWISGLVSREGNATLLRFLARPKVLPFIQSGQ
jgi:hypothetical protein